MAVGASHDRGVTREGEVPGKDHPLSPGTRKVSEGSDAELTVKEERVLESWRHGGDCWQRKLGVPKRVVGVCGLGQCESCAVAGEGHAECGWMQQEMRPEKQLCM